MSIFGGIEAGGTKFVCAIGSGPDDLREEIRFPTATPAESIPKAIAFFQEHGPLDAVGVASFGPIDPSPTSDSYGYVTTTPKPHWANTDFVGPLRAALNVPIGFDTDVNGAALAENRWGAAQGLDTFIYITVGTGIGGGAMVNGALLHGLMHAEMGHMLLPHDKERDPYAGWCPYHGDCFEGLANGPALTERWQVDPTTLPVGHPAWALEAHYLALGVVNMVTILSPQRVIMGGGVMDQEQLFPLVRTEVAALLNKYIQKDELEHGLDSFIVPPKLGAQAGVLGAIALAERAFLANG